MDLRLQAILAPFEYQHDLLMQQLTQLPAQLDTTHRRLAALFRALLRQPKFIIMDREWLGWLQQSRARQGLLSQLYDANTDTEYLFVISANNAPEGYTPIKVQYGLECGH